MNEDRSVLCAMTLSIFLSAVHQQIQVLQYMLTHCHTTVASQWKRWSLYKQFLFPSLLVMTEHIQQRVTHFIGVAA